MEGISMYKEMDITIKELEAALFKLGFVKKIKGDVVSYSHESGSKILLPVVYKPNRVLNKGWFIGNADNMAGMGAIEHRDDLAKLVETMRLEAVSTAA
jgi:predicted RNA binding protein YcfA (HicA-like mRNA interferase family)